MHKLVDNPFVGNFSIRTACPQYVNLKASLEIEIIKKLLNIVLEMLDSLMGCDLGNICSKEITE
jgi:hypothetical protein